MCTGKILLNFACYFTAYFDLCMQLESISRGQDLAKTDTSHKIDYLMSDIKALRLNLEDSLHTKTSSSLIWFREWGGLVNDACDQGSKLENVDWENGEFHAHLTNCLQETSKRADRAEHILETMNEKYIDLASRIYLLATEVQGNGVQSSSVERKVKDRESQYLSQMNARHQQETQVRIYNAMTQLQLYLARQQHSSRCLTWNASEENLVLQQYRANNGGTSNDQKRDN